MARWRFVHAADLHLDSPFVGLAQVHPQLRDALVSATFDSLRRLVDLCLACRAEFLLLAGDLFDGPRLSLKAQVRLRQELARLSAAAVETFIVWGNHDYQGRSHLSLDWPEGVTVFPAGEVGSREVCREGIVLARIFGVSHGSAAEPENLARRFPAPDPGPFTIGLLHANLDKSAGYDDYAPCSLADLSRPGYDYWALGHIHAPAVRRLAQPAVVYAGNPQGRHINESGPRGCYLVEVDGHEAHPQFQEIAAISWQVREVEVSGFSHLPQVAARLSQEVEQARPEHAAQGLMLRLTLRGRGPVHRELRLPGHLAELLDEVREQGMSQHPWVWVESFTLNTAPDYDLEAIRRGSGLAATVLKILKDTCGLQELPPEIKGVLESLYLSPQGRRYLPDLASLDWRTYLQDTADEILTRLFPGEEE
jgi:exonuclease SbcD|uniref:DNA repair exonuclease n=1 Tax=Desulfobacca acetoxidans TaxID=60893 RepID=A0A7V6A4Q9_9BACT